METAKLDTTNDNNVPSRSSKNTKRNRLLATLLDGMNYQRQKQHSQLNINEDPLIPRVEAIAIAADNRKASDIVVFRVQQMTEVALMALQKNASPISNIT